MENTGQAPQGPVGVGGGNPLMNQQPAPIAPPAGSSAPATAPTQGEADDAAWIEKARLVLRRSAGDPYTRQDAVGKLRALYVKQRFGKTIGEESD